MTRSVWTGSISFGLVNVPVKAYTAVRDHTVHFHQLEKGTGARIHHQNVSGKSGDPVEPDDIELGYEVRSGRYITFERDELDDLRPASTRAIEVSDFVALADVDPIYYQRTYWLGPADDGAKEAYDLLRAAMEERERVAIGSVVMRNKQYLAAIRPLDGALALSTMRFADEVVAKADIDEVPARRAKPAAKSLKLAIQIVDSLAADWNPEQYHDTYTEQLEEIIHRKDKGEDAVVEDAPSQQADVLDLMAALEASVEAAKGARTNRTARKALAEAAKELADDDRSDRSGSKGGSGSGRKSGAKQRPSKKRAPAKKAAAKRRKSA